MTRLARIWQALTPEQRLAAVAAIALLATMFLPWYGLQGLNRRTGVIDSHTISAFGDVSFVEAAIFLVAAGVLAMVLARGDGRDFQLPGGDGTIVVIAGCWAALLIFFRVFSRPPGGGEPVGIEWGFFLAFVAAGALAFAGLRMRASERPQAPTRRRTPRRPVSPEPGGEPPPAATTGPPAGTLEPAAEPPAPATTRSPAGTLEPGAARGGPAREAPAAEDTTILRPPAPRRANPVRAPGRERAPYPPGPPEQLSFEDPAAHAE